MRPGVDGPKQVRRWEWGVCVGATLTAIWLHWVCLHEAGGLWRDEASSVGLSAMPTLGELWGMLWLDGFPLYLPLALRVWSWAGLGQSDFDLRLYGFVVGLALLAALWFNARALGRRLPLMALGLLAVNVTLVRWGDSLRSYGSACVFLVVALGLVWRLVERPGALRYVLAVAGAVLSVQAAFQNAFILFAALSAGCLVCLRRRDGKRVTQLAGVGALAAASLVPYARVVWRSEEWRALLKSGFVGGWVWKNLAEAMGSPSHWLAGLWIALFLLGVVAGIRALRAPNEPESDLRLYASVTMVVGVACYLVFVKLTGLPSQVWYYLPVLTLVATCSNALAVPPEMVKEPDLARARSTASVESFTEKSGRRWNASLPTLNTLWEATGGFRVRLVSLVLVSLVVAISFPEADELVRCRQTNLDRIAQQLEEMAAPNDLVVLHPWYCGVTFNRYYRGKAPWTTIPPISDYRVQRFDLMRQQMLAENAMGPVLTQCEATLTRGGSLWLVGWFDFARRPAPAPPKPPQGAMGWNEVPYQVAWAQQVANLVVAHAAEFAVVTNAMPETVSLYENLPLYIARGWRTNALRDAGSPPSGAPNPGSAAAHQASQ